VRRTVAAKRVATPARAARFKGRCLACKGVITPGEEIRKNLNGLGWIHLACHEDLSLKRPASEGSTPATPPTALASRPGRCRPCGTRYGVGDRIAKIGHYWGHAWCAMQCRFGRETP
jgi:hypothetical protein